MIVHFMNDRSFSKKISTNLPKMIVHFINDRPFYEWSSVFQKISSNLLKMIFHFMNDRSFYEWSSVFKKYHSIYLKWSSILWMIVRFQKISFNLLKMSVHFTYDLNWSKRKIVFHFKIIFRFLLVSFMSHVVSITSWHVSNSHMVATFFFGIFKVGCIKIFP